MLVLLVLITFGIIGFDRAYNAQVTLTHASREGVRVLAITGDPAAATQAAKDGVSEAVRPSKGVPSGVSVGGIEEVVVATLSGLLAPVTRVL